MQEEFSARWLRAYRRAIEELPRTASAAGMTLCGMNTVIDARVDMKDVSVLPQPGEDRARDFFAFLRDRAIKGVGGEIRVEWQNGPAWIKSHLPIRHDLGGTGAHAARALAAVGAKALVALQDRSAQMLSLFPPDVMVAEGHSIVAAKDAARRGEPSPETFIFEFAAGSEVAGSVLPRSSRIIVRFDDHGVDVDSAFDILTPELASTAGAGLVSGFNNEPLEKLSGAIERIFGLTRAWMAAGVPIVHLELAGYASEEALGQVLGAVPGSVNSIGMSHSELLAMTDNGEDLASIMLDLGERLGVERVCVHADHWAAAATRGDPLREQAALVTGCLLASARAAAGAPTMPSRLASDTIIHQMALPEITRSGSWTVVSCPSPHLARPATTLGLGDTFTAGCLLALGRSAGARPTPNLSSAMETDSDRAGRFT